MMSDISRFCQAQRRTRPTVVDFQQMLRHKDIHISSLDQEVNRVPPTNHIPFDPPPPPSVEESDFTSHPNIVQQLLGDELDGGNDKRAYIPNHLPPFPSKHTYLTTPVFTKRPSEPRVIREMATQEAMLAENALRKILAAAAASAGGMNRKAAAANGSVEVSESSPSTEGEKGAEAVNESVSGDEEGETRERSLSSAAKRKNRDEVWEKAFNAIKASDEAEAKLVNGNASMMDFSFSGTNNKGKAAAVDANVWLEVTVNSDSQYWRGRGAGAGKAIKGGRQV